MTKARRGNNENSRIVNIIILALIVMAIGLGVKVYQQYFPSQPSKQNEASLNVSSSLDQSSTASAVQGKQLDYSKLSKEEKDVLNVPVVGSEEEKKKHFELAQKLAKSSDVLAISNCLGEPIVIKLKHGKTMTVKNLDAVEHEFQLRADLTYKIPAKGSKEVKVDFGKGPGLYGYGCDGTGPSGLLFVER